jgi:hypothetical protein
MLNDMRAVDTTERFEAWDRDGLLLFGISRDASLAPTGSRPFGAVLPFLLITKRDPQTGAMIGDCFRWDHFEAYSDSRSADAVRYFLLRAPVATYSINGKYDVTRRHFAIRPGVVSYLGDFILADSQKLEIRQDLKAARRVLLDYPRVGAELEPVELLPGGGGTLMMCGP